MGAHRQSSGAAHRRRPLRSRFAARSLAFSAAAALTVGLLIVLVTLPRRALDVPSSAATLAAIPGVIHVHTTRSDGTGTPDDIADAAARAGLRFVIFTDHGDGTRRPAPARYVDGVLCIEGVEISTTGGHYIALGLEAAPYPLAGEARDVVEDVARLGGFGIAGHPGSPKPELRWRDWTAAFDAIEWLNADSEWRDERPLEFARLLIQYPFRPAETLATLLDRPEAILARWDALTRDRRIIALAGTDAHARIGGRGSHDPYESSATLKLPSYESLFRTFSIRVRLRQPLTGHAVPDALRLLDAIRAGHVHSSVDAIARAKVFDFTATSGERTAHEGDSLTLDGPVTLRIDADVPTRAQTVLVRNGEIVASTQGGTLEVTDAGGPAVFRAEVRVDGAPGDPHVPWIVSNPIYVGQPGSEKPAPRARPVATRVADLQTVQIEHDAQSTASSESRRDGDVQIAALTYRLGEGARSGQYAAIVMPVDATVAQFDRVVFDGQSDRPARVSVQVRLDGAGERWRRSVYLDRSAGPVDVPFDDMTPAGSTGARSLRLDRARIRSLLIVVDTINSLPGSAGTITVGNLRFER